MTLALWLLAAMAKQAPAPRLASCHPPDRCAVALPHQGHCPAALLAAVRQHGTEQAAPACQQIRCCLLLPTFPKVTF